MAIGPAEKLKKEAYGALSSLKDNLSPIKLSFEDELEVVRAALKRHDLHISTHAIDQTHIDPFKLVCWLGWEILDRLDRGQGSETQAATVAESVMKTLNEILSIETDRAIYLKSADKKLLLGLLMEEHKGNGDHGIGFNGLFVAFHCFRSTYKQLKPKNLSV